MYRLTIQDKNGKWHDLDLGEDKPAMVYQPNDIAELRDRRADSSQAIRLPKTDNNAALFSFANVNDVVGSFPYERHPCRLYSNDYILAGKGSYLILFQIGQYFECQILGGIANFLDYLKDNKMESLDLGSAEISLDGLRAESNKYIFPAATFRTDSINATGSLENVELDRIFPCVYLKHIIETMASTYDYTLVHNIKAEDFDNKLISLATMKPDAGSLDMFRAYSNTTTTIRDNRPHYLNWSFYDAETANGRLSVYEPTSGESAIQYESPIDGTINVNVEYENFGAFNGWLIKIDKSGNQTIYNIWQSSDGGPIWGTGNKDFNIEVQIGDLIRLSFKHLEEPEGSPPRTLRYKFLVDSFETDVVPVGGIVPFSRNLGFDSQLDLFKAFAQLYGLIISVDNEKRIVYANNFDKVYDNKSIARDWTEKLHVTEDDNTLTTYDLKNYAQINTISFNPNDKITDVGTFNVNNASLTATKELFKIEFQAGKDHYQTLNGIGFTTANIPLLEYVVTKDADIDIVTATFKDGKPHILSRVDERVTLVEKESTEALELYPVNHATAQSFIDIHYNSLVNGMLNNAKKVEAFLNLNEYDIETFDPLIPVYLNSHGAYFYVNKIHNFMSDELTRCELIRL